VLSVHKAFDIFAMSSITEGLGTSVLDAMACSKPVVATRAGGIPEAVVEGVTGRLVEPRDHEGMARALIALLRDEGARRRMGVAGFNRVREHFSVERMVEETLLAYGGILRD
jgi:glycosyltransferase involved in cell wall biosynthesis